MSALQTQVGGSHYKDKAMQPVELWAALNLNAFQGAIVKYITRHKEKNGAADIDKAEHFFALMIELEQAKPLPLWKPKKHAFLRYAEENNLSEVEAKCLRSLFLLPASGRHLRWLDEIRRENGYPIPEARR